MLYVVHTIIDEDGYYYYYYTVSRGPFGRIVDGVIMAFEFIGKVCVTTTTTARGDNGVAARRRATVVRSVAARQLARNMFRQLYCFGRILQLLYRCIRSPYTRPDHIFRLLLLDDQLQITFPVAQYSRTDSVVFPRRNVPTETFCFRLRIPSRFFDRYSLKNN